MTPHFWPEKDLGRAFRCAFSTVSVEEIENNLQRMFPSGNPVLCSSARVAITLALIGSGLSRNDYVGVFPYASHCVLEAVSRVATPLPDSASINPVLRIVFHQWSYVQEVALSSNCIEDCADTLCRVGTELFPRGGAFELWSLPKILGTSGGGVLWCQSQDTARRLRQLRNERGGRTLLWLLRLAGYRSPLVHACWQGSEGMFGAPSVFQTGEIASAIKDWQIVVNDRQRKLEMAWPLAAPWLSRSALRLPCAVPVQVPHENGELLAAELGLNTGMRMLGRIGQGGQRSLHKVLPIPIHQSISIDKLQQIINYLSRRVASRSSKVK